MKFTIEKVGLSRAAAAVALAVSCLHPALAQATPAPLAPKVQLSDGVIEGLRMPAGQTHLQIFRGIPYAAPPVGEFRWREPQPVARWAGVRTAREFMPRCMQAKASPQEFRSAEMSEDCLYLNVWAPANSKFNEKLPVLVYFHGGGFMNGDGSEGRYDGANLAARGIVMVTVNYRLGAFGFLALPEAARESPHGAAGNYGLLDQVAALRWVRDNITKFGGDPSKVTIAGNSAGSIAVSAHMASPLSRGLFARAIGQSGGAFATHKLWEREQAERAATQFAERVDATSLQQLRALPAQRILDASMEGKRSMFWPHIDSHFLTDSPEFVFNTGGQAPVPLLVGANSQEAHFTAILGQTAPTPENWLRTVKALFPNRSDEVLAQYPGHDNNEVMHAGTALASDLFMGHSTWRWMQAHRETGRAPVYFYRFAHPRPAKMDDAQRPLPQPQPVLGAVHSAEIEYALGNMRNKRKFAWTAQDYEVSRTFSGYIEQFVKTGSPNGEASANSLSVAGAGQGASPSWPAVRGDNRGILQLVIGEDTHTTWDREAPRQGLIERLLESRSWNGATGSTSQ
jgi:para-nitrobenzyl esterase